MTNERNDTDAPQVRLGGRKASFLLLKTLEYSTECGDLATMDAAVAVIKSRVRGGLDDLYALWSRDDGRDFVDWMLVATPELKGSLKIATGRSRDEWLLLV